MAVHILGLCGSIRTGSYNEAFLSLALKLAEKEGATTEAFDLKANPIPLYDGDYEAQHGFPAGVLALKEAIEKADAVLLASPEYNASFTPLTKAAIDWASRSSSDLGQRNVWNGKPVAMIAASPSPFGGLRSIIALRPVLAHVNALALPDHCTLSSAYDAYTEEGELKDPRTADYLKEVVARLIFVAGRLKD